MRTIKTPEKRRNEILDTSEMLFATKGYVKTTINDILKTIGIAKGTFYYYFQSKEEVMNEIVMRFISIGVDSAKSIASDPNLKAPEKVFRIVTAQNQDTGRKEPIIQQFHQVNNAEMHQKSLVETILQLTPIITEIVKQGIIEGSFKTPYPKEVVEFLLVSSQFLFDAGLFQWKPQEIIEKSKAFAYIVESMLGSEKDSFSYIYKIYEQMIGNQNIKGEEENE